MKKKDLKSGMIVKTFDNSYYLVILDTGMITSDYSDKDVLVGINQNGNIAYGGWMNLESYNDNLENEDESYNIVEVLFTMYAADIGNIDRYKSVWKREGF